MNYVLAYCGIVMGICVGVLAFVGPRYRKASELLQDAFLSHLIIFLLVLIAKGY